MEYKWYEIISPESIISPSLLVFPSRIEENIKAMINISGDVKKLRTHIKTYKIKEIIQLQINYDINKHDNIMIMPNKKGKQELNINPNYLVHDGGHLKYNLYVKEQLDYIYDNFDDMDSYRYQFWLLQKHLRKNMKYNEDNLPWR